MVDLLKMIAQDWFNYNYNILYKKDWWICWI